MGYFLWKCEIPLNLTFSDGCMLVEEEEICLRSDSRNICMSWHFSRDAPDLLVWLIWKPWRGPVHSL